MRISNATGNPEYARLRAGYDAAFENLCAEYRKLQSMNENPASDSLEAEAARRRMEEAFRLYHERRDGLAEFLTRRPAGSNSRLRDLAYRLWEEAGRPLGRPDEYWYRAEEQLRRTA